MAARIVDIQRVEDFSKTLDQGGNGSISVALFQTSWAEQCQQMLDVMKELAKNSEFTHIKFITVEAEEFPNLSLEYGITAVPTTLFIQNKKEIHRIDGVHAAELTSKVRHFAAQSMGVSGVGPTQSISVSDASSNQSEEDLNTQLKKLVNKAPVMLFMKGSPDQPRCGFSKQTIQIMEEHNVKFDYFDILTDEAVRQGLKTYSDWPTYPQLYVNGDLLGGLDIIKEMVASGEFQDALPKQECLEDKLKRLIDQAPVMLFMKGDKNEPKCKFSRAVIDIINSTNVPYETFDILQDEEVRQGLKTYSDWPTYPQLYVKGELIGGLDIIKEMQENGELESSLKKE